MLCGHCLHGHFEWLSENPWWQEAKVRELSSLGFWKYQPWMAYECGYNLNPLTRDGAPCPYYQVHVERFLEAFAEIGHIATCAGVDP